MIGAVTGGIGIGGHRGHLKRAPMQLPESGEQASTPPPARVETVVFDGRQVSPPGGPRR